MAEIALSTSRPTGTATSFTCRDGVRLNGHIWPARKKPVARVIINAATGVLARYYHYYADFLAGEGFEVLTYDYRGIGLSRPETLRGCGYRWRDWGEQDFDAALRFMTKRAPELPLMVVGHSIGGYLPGLSPEARRIDRMLTMGAQYAWWGDYAAGHRSRLFWRWHMVMPALTAIYGYFPGRKLGWLEDLPAGVANEWSFRGPRMERTHPRHEREAVLSRFAAVTAPILAICVTDDDIGSAAAIRRTLSYYCNAERIEAGLSPSHYGLDAIGHFSLFHSRHADGFWKDTLSWLKNGVNPFEGSTSV
ncbi:alpha/beta hydrolase [Rhizobium wenxiniae]|uniref:Putative alpha/beta hydrolase n=1 Tax=Rhizobium wenxiniae TaxID=1737357 RepID=A0A7X0CZZ9_9HYPH|nr:alpha/beta fold hydrolase [Rhizobium wenxiniae]MBB6162849.1 putative alpha/beta hydrolase [Rhizobium wenxiniae]GGF95391.1 alpha/beta hydrolase [Rhizobium wenxiniae]